MQRSIRAGRVVSSRWRSGLLVGALLASSMVVTSQRNVQAEDVYTVEYGDTLSHIAINYGFTVNELVLLNGIEDPDLIFPGDQIALGGYGNGTGEPATVSAAASEPAPVSDTGVEEAESDAGSGAEWVEDESADAAAAQGGPEEWPPYVERWYIRDLLIDAAHRYGWDPTLIMAQAWQESYWTQDVISWTGAIGVLQIMPATGAEMEDWYFQRDMDVFMSVEDNIETGVAYLSVLYEETGSVELALASYYQGWWSVQNDGFFPDTEEYVERIFTFQEMFKNGELP